MEDHSIEVEEMLLNAGYEGALYLTGPDYITAIAGVSHDGRVVYSYEDMVSYLMTEGEMTEEEAEDFISNDTIKAINYMNQDYSPIILYDLY